MPYATLAIIVGAVAAATLVVVRLFLRELPRHRACPTCRFPTAALQARGALRHFRWLVRRRWCSVCGWEGVANPAPPVEASGGDLGHDSGFRWSRSHRNRTGFRWAGPRTARRPAHPARRAVAFRWGHGGSLDRVRRPAAADFRFRPGA